MKNTYLALANQYTKRGHKSVGEERKEYFDKARKMMKEHDITVGELAKFEPSELAEQIEEIEKELNLQENEFVTIEDGMLIVNDFEGNRDRV